VSIDNNESTTILPGRGCECWNENPMKGGLCFVLSQVLHYQPKIEVSYYNSVWLEAVPQNGWQAIGSACEWYLLFRTSEVLKHVPQEVMAGSHWTRVNTCLNTTNQDFILKNEIKEGWKTTFVRFLHKIPYFLPDPGIAENHVQLPNIEGLGTRVRVCFTFLRPNFENLS